MFEENKVPLDQCIGVGVGIILNGEVFEGGIMGGSEVGHMVVRQAGRQCTCGRKGCLEAYASVPSLLKAARQRKNREVSLQEIFSSLDDIDMEEVVEQYREMLGTGIVNIVNLFRPQLILLGGALSPYIRQMIPDLKTMMEEDCFGGVYGTIPELSVAQLGDTAGMIGAANLQRNRSQICQ